MIMNLAFTDTKKKDDNLDKETVVDEDYISAYQTEIELWRDALTDDWSENF